MQWWDLFYSMDHFYPFTKIFQCWQKIKIFLASKKISRAKMYYWLHNITHFLDKRFNTSHLFPVYSMHAVFYFLILDKFVIKSHYTDVRWLIYSNLFSASWCDPDLFYHILSIWICISTWRQHQVTIFPLMYWSLYHILLFTTTINHIVKTFTASFGKQHFKLVVREQYIDCLRSLLITEFKTRAWDLAQLTANHTC